jgi:hypothetical protein
LSVAEGSVVFTSKANGESVTVTSGQTVVATSDGFDSTPNQNGSDDSLIYIVGGVIVVAVLVGVVFFVSRRRKPKTA